jgi:hypothetical protein
MIPLGCSGCGHDNVKLFMVELTWCMMGTIEGAANRKQETGRETGSLTTTLYGKPKWLLCAL